MTPIRRRSFIKAGSAAGIAGFAGCTGIGDGGSGSDSISIHYGVLFTEDVFSFKTFDKIFLEKVKEKADREVEISYTPADAIGGGPSEMESLISAKTVDMGTIAPSYTPDTFPYDSVAALPALAETAEQSSNAYWELVDPEKPGMIYEETYAEQGLRPVSVFLWPPYELYTVDTKVTSMNDFQGMNLRAPGGAQQLTAENLEASAVDLEGQEAYQALERGTIDALMFSPSNMRSFGLHEVVGYGTDNLPLVSFENNLAINQDVFDSYPDDFQQTLIEAGQETITDCVANIQEHEVTENEAMAESGVEIYSVQEDLVATIENQLEPVAQGWADQRGDFAHQVLEQYKSLL